MIGTYETRKRIRQGHRQVLGLDHRHGHAEAGRAHQPRARPRRLPGADARRPLRLRAARRQRPQDEARRHALRRRRRHRLRHDRRRDGPPAQRVRRPRGPRPRPHPRADPVRRRRGPQAPAAAGDAVHRRTTATRPASTRPHLAERGDGPAPQGADPVRHARRRQPLRRGLRGRARAASGCCCTPARAASATCWRRRTSASRRTTARPRASRSRTATSPGSRRRQSRPTPTSRTCSGRSATPTPSARR